jgi:hypothetical protein
MQEKPASEFAFEDRAGFGSDASTRQIGLRHNNLQANQICLSAGEIDDLVHRSGSHSPPLHRASDPISEIAKALSLVDLLDAARTNESLVTINNDEVELLTSLPGLQLP